LIIRYPRGIAERGTKWVFYPRFSQMNLHGKRDVFRWRDTCNSLDAQTYFHGLTNVSPWTHTCNFMENGVCFRGRTDVSPLMHTRVSVDAHDCNRKSVRSYRLVRTSVPCAGYGRTVFLQTGCFTSKQTGRWKIIAASNSSAAAASSSRTSDDFFKQSLRQ